MTSKPKAKDILADDLSMAVAEVRNAEWFADQIQRRHEVIAEAMSEYGPWTANEAKDAQPLPAKISAAHDEAYEDLTRMEKAIIKQKEAANDAIIAAKQWLQHARDRQRLKKVSQS